MKKFLSKLMIIPAICMVVSTGAMAAEADISVQEVNNLGAANQSINEVGTYHDNSWDGVRLKKV